MEIQFQKKSIACLRTICRQYESQELTQELRLPDPMPDIGTVLCSWGQPIIRSKQWHSGSAGVTGGVMLWVLYIPEDGSGVQQAEAWLPLQQSWDFAENAADGNLQVIPVLRSVDARTLSARKMMLRASVGLLGQATVPGEVELFSPGELPEDVKILKNSYPVQLPVEAGEKAFSIEQPLTLPGTEEPVEKILRYQILPQLTEEKLVSDKLVFRGVANASVLYLGTDGQLHTWDFELPFSQYAQLDADYEQDARAEIAFAVTNLELEPGEDNSLNLKAGLTGQYTIYATPVLELVEDAYAINRSILTQKMQLQIPAVLDGQVSTVSSRQTAQTDMLRVVDAAFYPDQPHIHRQGDGLEAELSGTFQILGYSPDMELQTVTSRWEQNWNMHVSPDSGVEMLVQPGVKTVATVGAGDVTVQTDMLLQTKVTSQQGLEMVTGLQLGEPAEQDPNRPSIILTRAGDRSLWALAKENGSTVEAIRQANNLQTQPDENRMLLVPVL